MPMAEVPDLMPVLPELFLAVMAMGLLMVGVFTKGRTPEQAVKAARTVNHLSVVTLFLTLLLLATVPGGRVLAFGGLFVSDGFALFFKALVLLASGMALFMSDSYLERQGMARFEYGVLILFATLGMLMMVSANNLISLYIGLELQSLSLYVIAAFQRDDSRSTEAGLKYFVLGAVASGLLLYGSSLVYGFTGSTDFEALATLFREYQGHRPPVGLVFGLVFVMAGLAFKVSAAPFHMWTPDVYEGAPTPVTAFFSVAPKIAALALLLRVAMGPFAGLAPQWQQIIVLVAGLSMFVGAFAALVQRNIKRLMAYSSISHVGYALIGLAAADHAGMKGVLVYLAIYLFMNIGTFACILAMRRGDRMVESIDDLAGLSKTHPPMALAMAIFMFSMAGIPPLAGFFGKLYIFLAAVNAGLIALAVFGLLASVVGAFYYIRIVKIMYFDEPAEALDRTVPREVAGVMMVAGVVVLLFFLYPGLLLSGAEAASAALFPPAG
jgi:NADH-quinone oxidoreductase subunit N